jgi:hypothetical protein
MNKQEASRPDRCFPEIRQPKSISTSIPICHSGTEKALSDKNSTTFISGNPPFFKSPHPNRHLGQWGGTLVFSAHNENYARKAMLFR